MSSKGSWLWVGKINLESKSPGGPVIHHTAHGGNTRIDPAPKTEDKPKPQVASGQPDAKPLSRLEQLREKK